MKAYIYKLIIPKEIECDIIGVGSVILNEIEIGELSGLERIKTIPVGYYITGNGPGDDIEIEMKLAEDYGEKIYCKLDLRVMHTSEYTSSIVCESISISRNSDGYPRVATFERAVDDVIAELDCMEDEL